MCVLERERERQRKREILHIMVVRNSCLAVTERAQDSLRICRDGSVSTFSESVDSDSVDAQAYPNHVY